MSAEDDDNRRFRCPHCETVFKRNVQPCPNCGNSARMELIQQVDERIDIQERRTRVLETLERQYPWSLGSIAVTVLVPVITLILGLGDPMSAIISVIAGLVAVTLGTYGVILVKRIYE